MRVGDLKVGLIGPLPPPSGGMAMQTLQLARLLQEEGVDVQLVQTNAAYSPRVIEKVKGLRALFRLLPYLWKVWCVVGRADLIHLMANSGWSWQLFAAPVIWIGWMRKTPVIVNYRGGEAQEYLEASWAWIRPSLAKTSALVVPSTYLQEVFNKFGILSEVIPNIIDLETFCPAPQRASGGSFTIVITRNLEPIYGLATAIRAMSIVHDKLPSVYLKVAGSGPQRAELEQLVASLNLTDVVCFLGRLERADIVELYHSADAMLNPTTVDNMPNSVLEALACGVPVISTEVGGVPYIVRDGETAMLVPVDNEQEMAQAIITLYNDVSLRDSLIKNGQCEVAQYSWGLVKPKWLALYNSIGVTA